MPPRIPTTTIRPLLRPSLPHHAAPIIRTHSTGHTGSLDPSEVAHFNVLAEDWWNPHGSSRLLHLMNPLRLRFIESCLAQGGAPKEQGKQGMVFMDVGCGGGILAESLARLPVTRKVVAVDPTPEVLKIARAHMRRDPALKGRLEYKAGTVEAVGFGVGEEGGKGFDVVTTMEVVEHVNNPYEFLANCMKHVKPGGWLIGSTIARTWTSYLTTKLIAEDILRIVPRGTHDWNKYLNADELERFFGTQEGWEERRFMGCLYVPGMGWREMEGAEKLGNYFFGVRKALK